MPSRARGFTGPWSHTRRYCASKGCSWKRAIFSEFACWRWWSRGCTGWSRRGLRRGHVCHLSHGAHLAQRHPPPPPPLPPGLGGTRSAGPQRGRNADLSLAITCPWPHLCPSTATVGRVLASFETTTTAPAAAPSRSPPALSTAKPCGQPAPLPQPAR